MLMVISSAKKLDFSDAEDFGLGERPLFSRQAGGLVRDLRKLSVTRLQNFMGVSRNLAELNFARYRDFEKSNKGAGSKVAVLALNGDVYRSLGAVDFGKEDLQFADRHLRIISGLYGILRPTDKIVAHRLEMGAGLATSAGENLYDFWGDRITEHVNEVLGDSGNGDSVLVNLASAQYFRSVRRDILRYPVLDIDFKEERGGQFRTIALLAKRARGLMVRYAILNRVDRVEGLRGFSEDGYSFSADLSDDGRWVFVRKP